MVLWGHRILSEASSMVESNPALTAMRIILRHMHRCVSLEESVHISLSWHFTIYINITVGHSTRWVILEWFEGLGMAMFISPMNRFMRYPPLMRRMLFILLISKYKRCRWDSGFNNSHAVMDVKRRYVGPQQRDAETENARAVSVPRLMPTVASWTTERIQAERSQ